MLAPARLCTHGREAHEHLRHLGGRLPPDRPGKRREYAHMIACWITARSRTVGFLEFGTRTQTTRGVLPQDMRDDPHMRTADRKTDWYMLAAVLSEKALGLKWGEGASNPTRKKMLEALKSADGAVYRDIWNDITSELG